ncbi:hypothetical protein HX021_18585 [Sphingobacterium sp. N143]|uniref:hypothetical protein n=1 Tax=Sphingobacterium sp. N143 TaxID=2746727 RepID=UPI002578BE01|nr:hypothetical protein [Sphingobacterium sp. N143]MDM1296296.1 hypothetical protein [Sphingobacterium sp. N143]
MPLKDKLRLEISSNRITFQPNRRLRTGLFLFAAIDTVLLMILLLFNEKIGDGGRVFIPIIIICITIKGLYDLFFQLNVRYTFDDDQIVYRESTTRDRKKLMKFEEVVIFIGWDFGGWHYRLGTDKKTFLKSYKISPSFRNRRNYEKMAMEYENEFLRPIKELLNR